MRARICNKDTEKELPEMVQPFHFRTMGRFNREYADFSDSGIENELERYKVIADYFGENPSQNDCAENQGYTQLVINRLSSIYSHLREQAGLSLKILAEHPELATSLMARCSRVLENAANKTTASKEYCESFGTKPLHMKNDTKSGTHKQD